MDYPAQAVPWSALSLLDLTKGGLMLVVLNVVGLSPRHIDDRMPRTRALMSRAAMAPMKPVFPALTCSAQASMLTGKAPSDHGIVANGWYFRDLAQVWLWRQSNHLIQSPRLYDDLKAAQPGIKIAKIFWWYNMYAQVDFAVTPRPAYPADGRKMPDIYTHPQSLRNELQEKLGPFPLFQFWGPGAGIKSTRWIADCAMEVLRRERPDLSLVYLPHLDYDLQRFGPNHENVDRALAEVDQEIGRLIEAAKELGAEVVILSEYGIERVEKGIAINRRLRELGWLQVYTQVDGEHLDAGASRAFAVADHQVAHVYVARPQDLKEVKRVVEGLDGVDRVLDEETKAQWGIAHDRSGELIAIAEPNRWFTYNYWLNDDHAPDYARTVDIHKKPGYDPLELFVDPTIPVPQVKIASKLAKKALGFRYTMDVISLDDTLVKGSHGRLPSSPEEGPVFLSTLGIPDEFEKEVPMLSVRDILFDLTRRCLRSS